VVDSCVGHVRDLPRSARELPPDVARTDVLGVDVVNDYEPRYVVPEGKRSIVARLQKMAATQEGCVGVILATDEDREGEAIAWHLRELLLLGEDDGGGAGHAPRGEGGEDEDGVEMTRVTFNEITESAIRRAFFGDVAAADEGDAAMSDSIITEAGHGIDMDLVSAQETRRVLDRLAGYTVSPLLWKKVAPGLSAGRVQSVGLKLVVDRERERMRFKTAEYWDARATLCASSDEVSMGDCFNATLVSLNDLTVASGKDFDGETGLLLPQVGSAPDLVHLTEETSKDMFGNVGADSTWTVSKVVSRARSNTPPAPFITSTLQQESNKRLGLSVSDTMRAAQMLYEGGYISYMRTDSTHLSNDALEAGRKAVTDGFGAEFLSDVDPNAKSQKKKRKGKKDKDKNSQEAHEAIRPAIQEGGRFLRPDEVPGHYKQKSGGGVMADRALDVYDLVFKRTAASFMKDQVLNQTSVWIDLVDGKNMAKFRAGGSVVVFRGYAAAWGGVASVDASQSILPPLTEGQELNCAVVEPVEHHTKPPPRYTEASFVKELETLGVGRPSTYASVVQTLRQRAYIGTPIKADEVVRSKGKAASGAARIAQRVAGGDEFMGSGRGPLCPSLSAFVVCTLLEKHFPAYVDPSFTASMEDKLDSIASGKKEEATRVSYLDAYYGGDDGLAAQVERVEKSIDSSEARRADLPALMTKSEDNEEDDIGLFIGPWGGYIQRVGESSDQGKKPTTANLPQGLAADLSAITPDVLGALLSAREKDGVLIGTHPDDGRNIRLKIGRYGAYLQWGDQGEDDTTNHSLPKDIGGSGGRNIDLASGDGASSSLGTTLGISLEDAVGYIGLPRTVCEFHDLPVLANIGPYGPYLKYNNTFVSLPKAEGDVLTVNEETAKKIVTEGIINKPSGLPRGVLAEIGEKEGSKVVVKDGRFGMYLNWKRVNVKMPPEYQDKPEDLPLEEAWSLIQTKAGSTASQPRGGRKTRGKSIDLPPPPKRPLSAYLHFCAEKRPEVAENAGSLGEVSKALAAMWAETATKGERGRKKYEDLAEAGKEEYEEKKRTWQEECDRIMGEAGLSKASTLTGRKKKKPTNGVKRPRSAYLHFCQAKRPDVAKEGMPLGDVSKELARLWAETAENGGEERRRYQELAAADKERYEKEVDGAGSVATSNGATAAVRKRASPGATKGKKSGTKKATRKAKLPRAPSAYMLFCSENRKNVVKDDGTKPTFGETTKLLAEMWRTCDQTKYHQQAAEEKQKLIDSSADSTAAVA